jgi:hypothetical protein
MNAQSLWFDEIGTVRIAITPLSDLIRAVEGGDDVEPTACSAPRTTRSRRRSSGSRTSRPTSSARDRVALGVATIPASRGRRARSCRHRRTGRDGSDRDLAVPRVVLAEVRPYALLVL